jgi:hypothetical protein
VLGQALYHLSHISSFYLFIYPGLVIFQVGSFVCLGQPETMIPTSSWDFKNVSSPHVNYWLKWDFTDILPGLALNHNPDDLCLQSSWDYSVSYGTWVEIFFRMT